MTIFNLFVQVGRVALVTYGDHLNKLVTIIDIIDQNRVLVNGPDSTLREENLKNLTLLPILLTGVTKDSSKDEWKKAWETQKVEETYAKSKRSEKIHKKQLRAGLSDFQRFVVTTLKKKRNGIINAQLKEIKDKLAPEEAKKAEKRKAELAKIEKNKRAKLAKSFKRLSRKIRKKKDEEFFKAHPEKKPKEKTPKKRTPGRQRKKSDEPERLKRKAEGEKKRKEKLQSKEKK